MRTSDSIAALAAAFATAQADIRGAAKDRQNPHFKSDYATLASVIDAGRDALAKNGLAVLQGLSTAEGELVVTTRLLHKSGEWIEESLAVPLAKRDAQGMGSAATYGRRYALAAMLGIAQVDDDGNAAARPEPPVQRVPDKVVADLKASLDEADSLDQLRTRTRKAFAVVQQGGDSEAFAALRAYSAKCAEKFQTEAA